MEWVKSIFQLIAGTGLFLFAMYLVEESLRQLSGRGFKLFLQRLTNNRIGAAGGGALVSAVLQSSSMVSVMVLAFVGAGLFSMKNAMALILGANLGTTISGWLVAGLGFKMDIAILAYPALGIGGLLLILAERKKTIKQIALFLCGFGLLFIALSFMKTAMQTQVDQLDFKRFSTLPLFAFMLIGFAITFLIQSSSVSMALTLAALHAGALDLSSAAAIVLGSETGTTIKLLLGSLGDSAVKKRLAVGNLLFNVFISIAAFIFLQPILLFITEIIGLKDPLLALVSFSSLINLTALLIFLPLLDWYGELLERLFQGSSEGAAAYISSTSLPDTDTAIDLLHRETAYFISHVMQFNLLVFQIKGAEISSSEEWRKIEAGKRMNNMTEEERYEYLKSLQGEIQHYYLQLVKRNPDKADNRLEMLIAAVRSAMHSAKSINDIATNISNLSRSSKHVKYDFFLHHRAEAEDMYQRLHHLMQSTDSIDLDQLQKLFAEVQHNFSSALNEFYRQAQIVQLESLDITTVLNFNRELFTAHKALLVAIKNYLLFDKPPGLFNESLMYQT